MRISRKTSRPIASLAWLLVLLALALGPVAASAAEPDSVLGPNGDVYRLLLGTQSDLFPDQDHADDTPVLVLEILQANAIERVLVPGSEDEDVETGGSLAFDELSGTVYLTWSTQFNWFHSRITVLAYRDGAFSDRIEITGDPFSRKSAPQMVFTTEQFSDLHGDSADEIFRERRILHTLWWEDGSLGRRVLYAPLVIVDGELLHDYQLVSLPAFGPESTTAPNLQVSTELEASPALWTAPGSNRVLATLVDPGDGQLETFEIEPLSPALIQLGDAARAHIIEIGATVCGDGSSTKIADAARAHIIEIGRERFHPSVLDFVAEQTRGSLIKQAAASTDCDDALLGEIAREQVFASGSDAASRSGRKTASEARAHIIEIGRQASGLEHRLRIRQIAALEAPTTDPGETHVFTSPAGGRTLIAWEGPGQISYVQSQGSGWSEPRSLRVDEYLSREQALAILSRRLSR